MSLTAKLRDLFSMRWVRPVTDHEAGQVLSRRASEAKRRSAAALAERQANLHCRIRAELNAGLVCGKPTPVSQ